MSNDEEKDLSNPTSADTSPPLAEIKDSYCCDIAQEKFNNRTQTIEQFLMEDFPTSPVAEAQPNAPSLTKENNDETPSAISFNKPINSANNTTNDSKNDPTSTNADIDDNASKEAQKKAEKQESFVIVKRFPSRISPDEDELEGIEKWEQVENEDRVLEPGETISRPNSRPYGRKWYG